MKNILILLSSIIVFSCSLATKKQKLNDTPDFLMESFPFVLGLLSLDTYEDLEEIYISAGSESYINKIAFEYPHIKIEYHYSLNGRTVEKDTFTLKADNNEYFTIGELIYKINMETYHNLKDYEHKGFEGLEYIGTGDNIPVYRIAQGD